MSVPNSFFAYTTDHTTTRRSSCNSSILQDSPSLRLDKSDFCFGSPQDEVSTVLGAQRYPETVQTTLSLLTTPSRQHPPKGRPHQQGLHPRPRSGQEVLEGVDRAGLATDLHGRASWCGTKLATRKGKPRLHFGAVGWIFLCKRLQGEREFWVPSGFPSPYRGIFVMLEE